MQGLSLVVFFGGKSSTHYAVVQTSEGSQISVRNDEVVFGHCPLSQKFYFDISFLAA